MDAPSLGNGGVAVPVARPARPLAPRVIRQAPVAPPTRAPGGRAGRTRRLAQKVLAGGALLFIGSLVVVTSLPAQAVQPAAGIDPEVAQIHDVQTLESISAEATTYFARDDVTVNDQMAAARMSAGERAAYQAVADGEPVGRSYTGDPAFPQVWSMLETGFVQTPFPSMDQVPMSSQLRLPAGRVPRRQRPHPWPGHRDPSDRQRRRLGGLAGQQPRRRRLRGLHRPQHRRRVRAVLVCAT